MFQWRLFIIFSLQILDIEFSFVLFFCAFMSCHDLPLKPLGDYNLVCKKYKLILFSLPSYIWIQVHMFQHMMEYYYSIPFSVSLLRLSSWHKKLLKDLYFPVVDINKIAKRLKRKPAFALYFIYRNKITTRVQ